MQFSSSSLEASGEAFQEAEARLLEVLTSLNQIGATINQIGPRDTTSVASRLGQIVESATKVVPGAAAVIYTYDEVLQAFDAASRVSAGEYVEAVPGDEPRPDGMGRRAVDQRRRVISYEELDLPIHPIKARAGAQTVACFPLIVAEQIVGALYVYLHQARPFSQIELLMLENFVNQAAMVIYQTRQLSLVRQDLSRKEDELDRLRYAGLLISSRLNLNETLEAILQMALEVTGARYGIFRLMDRQGHNLITGAVAGEQLSRPLVEALPVDAASIMGWVAIHRQPICIPDLLAEPWFNIYYRLDADLEMRSELAVPLIGAGDRLEGVLNLESPQVGAFSEQDSHLLQALATQAVIAIQEARLVDALQEVAQLLLAQPCQQVLGRLVELACELLNAAASAIWTLEPEPEDAGQPAGAAETLVLRAASPGYVPQAPGPGQSQQAVRRLPLHGSLAGEAVLTRSAVTAEDVRSEVRFSQPDLARANGWKRALIVPLLASGDHAPLGAFSVYSLESGPEHFAESEWDKKVLTCLAHYAVLAVQNAAHLEALQLAQEKSAVAETFAAIGDIAANLLHSLNNKVGTIPVRIQGIQDKSRAALLADPYLAMNLTEIERSASEAMETVRLNLSYLNPIYLVPVNVVSCVKSAIDEANLPDSMQVHMEGLDKLPAVIAGERSLALVFTNLFENAANAMHAEGIVEVRGSAGPPGTSAPGGAGRKGWVEIAVSDSGPGIPAELHDRIFELHFSGRTSTRPGRLGFGLWWVKTVMTRLGGSIAVESDGAHGTTFRLKLPSVAVPGEGN
jgi:signal transduction histidine kinase/putative methionine-R-sulfoxide reductase with GAF domain